MDTVEPENDASSLPIPDYGFESVSARPNTSARLA